MRSLQELCAQLYSAGSVAVPHNMWDLLGLRIEPVSTML